MLPFCSTALLNEAVIRSFQEMRDVNCLLVGEGDIGKTKLITRYLTNIFVEGEIACVHENKSTRLTMSGKNVNLIIWDKASELPIMDGKPIFNKDVKADIVIICFSATDRESFNNVRNKWYPALQMRFRRTPALLVALKCDLRPIRILPFPTNDTNEKQNSNTLDLDVVTYFEGRDLAKEIDAFGYVETSAKTGEGVGTVFYDAVVNALFPLPTYQNSENSSCACMIM